MAKKRARVKYRTRYVPRRSRRANLKGKVGGRLLRGADLKLTHILAAGLAIPIIGRFQPFGGQYKPLVDMAATGAVLNVAGLGGGDLLSAAAKLGVSTVLGDVINGFIGGGSTATNGGL